MADPSASTSSAAAPAPADGDHLAHGIRALALKKWNDACDHLAQAVESSTAKHGDLAPENVDPLVLYGKALLNSAIAQSAVLGGAAPQGEPASDAAPAASSSAAASGPSASTSSGPAAGPSSAKFHFGGDAEDDDADEGADGEDGEEGGAEGEDDGGAAGGDREDDLESAFQVLDLARTILSKQVDEIETELERVVKEGGDGAEGKKGELEETRKSRKEKLADVHRLLGDVATESEQFDNAVEEYSSALSTLSRILAPYDRALSELHMLIALALDFVPNATSRAVSHAEKAKGVLVLKLAELEKVPEQEREDKAKREIEDIRSLMGDVDMKIEDLRTVPEAPAPTAADSALEALLRQSSNAMASAAASGSINDLTSLVKKKKKAAPAPGIVQEEVKPAPADGAQGGAEENLLVVKEEVDGASAEGSKRKADEDGTAPEGDSKKPKVEG
ncbi:uncharacterized protein JCM10292_003751 [Rhodotorula paludigena]|uniref:uncharacterized protein n=1 Tax=Rhodotorula paludigena TaxID=86838 RepID=UPI0031795379